MASKAKLLASPVSDKKERDYLLKINPHDLCLEFKTYCPEAYHLLTNVMLGMQTDMVLDSQHLKNNICLMFSILARLKNRTASGHALFTGMILRDGGLQEESLKLFPEACHPRTLAKYDHVLAAHSEAPLKVKLDEEDTFNNKLAMLMEEFQDKSREKTEEELTTLCSEIQKMNIEAPAMLTTVWDNINIRADHRFERVNDRWEDNNYDYTTSMHMKPRINANHLDNAGKAFKQPQELKFEDFVPSNEEKELLFCSMIPLFSFALLQRYPELFKCLKSSIKDHHPHQYQKEMNQQTEEYTGQIYEKSENKTEDLVSMISDYQSKMSGKSEERDRILYRRQLTGDQKTEKNTHYAILRSDIRNSL